MSVAQDRHPLATGPDIDENRLAAPDGEAMTAKPNERPNGREVLTPAGSGQAWEDGRQSEAAANIARGAMRLLATLNFAAVTEFTLASGRRADIAALGPKGEIWIAEIKSSIADFRADSKWPEYRDYCDRLFFAVDGEFPLDILPEDTGLIVADRFGAEMLREAPEHRLPAARRRAVSLAFARVAAVRLHAAIDPYARHAPQ